LFCISHCFCRKKFIARVYELGYDTAIEIFSFILLVLMVLFDMKIVITSGGTIEKIDEVRHITNNSTGTLGCAFAESFLRFEEIEEIIYVCALTAVIPQNKDRVKVCRIAGVQDLQDTLRRCYQTKR